MKYHHNFNLILKSGCLLQSSLIAIRLNDYIACVLSCHIYNIQLAYSLGLYKYATDLVFKSTSYFPAMKYKGGHQMKQGLVITYLICLFLF